MPSHYLSSICQRDGMELTQAQQLETEVIRIDHLNVVMSLAENMSLDMILSCTEVR